MYMQLQIGKITYKLIRFFTKIHMFRSTNILSIKCYNMDKSKWGIMYYFINSFEFHFRLSFIYDGGAGRKKQVLFKRIRVKILKK
jgi:hypothetical protein